jgi:hypothetical protein
MNMAFSFSNVIGLLVFLALGLLCLWIFHRFIYPLLSARYEKAKVTLTQGRDPARLSRVVYLLSLLLLPILGFLLGGTLDW